jgi:hypothetical protein
MYRWNACYPLTGGMPGLISSLDAASTAADYTAAA